MTIGLGYKARSGKNTVADYLIRHYRFKQASFAGPLREAIFQTIGIRTITDEEKNKRHSFWNNMSGREILQKFGTDGLRAGFNPDIWVKLALYDKENHTRLYMPDERVAFTDLRFENEADEIRNLGGKVIRIDRAVAGLEGEAGTHASENGLNDYPHWDYILDNNGNLQELYDNVDALMDDLGIGKCSLLNLPPIMEELTFKPFDGSAFNFTQFK